MGSPINRSFSLWVTLTFISAVTARSYCPLSWLIVKKKSIMALGSSKGEFINLRTWYGKSLLTHDGLKKRLVVQCKLLSTLMASFDLWHSQQVSFRRKHRKPAKRTPYQTLLFPFQKIRLTKTLNLMPLKRQKAVNTRCQMRIWRVKASARLWRCRGRSRIWWVT